MLYEIRLHVNTLKSELETVKARSAWNKGVKLYAEELLESYREICEYEKETAVNSRLFEKALLNGASDWDQYSWGGCSLIYDREIAERLCTPSELKKKKGGQLRPNGSEEWLDVQARALFQASRLLTEIYKRECWA